MNNTIKQTGQKKMLNVGCGDRFHPAWTNIDFFSNSPSVISHNLLKGIPYPDNTFDVVYHSHTLEHFRKDDAIKFIDECYRVLKSGGIIRIAVPNLENIIKNYLSTLESALKGDTISEANYDWTMLELYDQCVRTKGGGEMKNYFKQKNILNEDFVKGRIGHFYDIMTRAHRNPYLSPVWKNNIKKIIPILKVKNAMRRLRNKFPGYGSWALGRFRQSGEIHQWMYDRFSLARLLKHQGFSQIFQRKASESYIEDWSNYNLDTEPDGAVYKTDSLFIEAKK